MKNFRVKHRKRNSDTEGQRRQSMKRKYSLGIHFIANKEKLKIAMAEYVETSSIHGLKAFSENYRSKSEKITWAIFLIIVVICNLWMVVYIYDDFLDAPTATTLLPTRKPVTLVPFPAIAICSGNRLSRRRLMQLSSDLFVMQSNTTIKIAQNISEMYENIMLLGSFFNINLDEVDYYKLDKLHNFLTEAYNGSYSSSQLVIGMYLPCDQSIKECRLHGQVVSCKKIFILRKTHIGRCCTFNYQRLTEEQFWTFWKTKITIPPAIPFFLKGPGIDMGLSVIMNNDLTDYAFALNSNIASFVYVFDPLDFPDEASGATVEQMISPGQEMFLSVHPQPVIGSDAMRDVPYSSRKCFFKNEEKLVYDNFYSFAECNLACRMEDLINFCQCIPFYMNGMFNVSECQLNDIMCLQKWHDKWSNVEASTNDRRLNGLSIHCPHCLPTCNYIKYRIQSSYGYIRGKVNNVTRNKLIAITDSVVHIYFGQSYVNEFQQTIVHTWYELLSMFGGIFSIMLGTSIVSAIEFLYFISGKFTTMFWEKKVKLDNQTNVPVPMGISEKLQRKLQFDDRGSSDLFNNSRSVRDMNGQQNEQHSNTPSGEKDQLDFSGLYWHELRTNRNKKNLKG